MKPSQHQCGSTTAIEYTGITNRHRQQQSDVLLASNPPLILEVGILAVAILLGIFAVIMRSIEYQDLVPITLTLKTAPPHHPFYGEGILQQSDLMKVHPDQVVLIDLRPYQGASAKPLELKVSEISTVCNNSQSVIRVDLPPDLAAILSRASLISKPAQLNGKIVIRKYSIYKRLFKNLLASSRPA